MRCPMMRHHTLDCSQCNSFYTGSIDSHSKSNRLLYTDGIDDEGDDVTMEDGDAVGDDDADDYESSVDNESDENI